MNVNIEPLQNEMIEVNRLYMIVMSLYSTISDMESQKKELAQKIGLITDGIEDDSKTTSLLQDSHHRISGELHTAQNEVKEVKSSLQSVGDIVDKLEKMDLIKTELGSLRRRNASLRLKVTPLSAKMWGMQERLFNLRKDKEKKEKEHTNIMKLREQVITMRSKVLPKSELLNLQDRLAKETSIVKKNTYDIGLLKEKIAGCVPERDRLHEELQGTIERLSTIQDHIAKMKEKVTKLAPKLMSDEEVQKIKAQVKELQDKKDQAVQEKKKISPQMASIAEEEEKLSTILESYQAKYKKEKDKLQACEKELKELNVDPKNIDTMREEVSTVEADLELKRKGIENLKKEHAEVLAQNQKDKAIIDEVSEGTAQLKKMMKKKK